LSKINFEFKQGDKIAVIGKVGNGKTSLLLSILGEMRILAG
jgi:ABC-type transport system involved in cytochrome bd biosynthesis fused ATPase/permease subunit